MGKILLWLQKHVKRWIKPATSLLIIGVLSDLTRNQTDLVVENAFLRQQLIALNRQIKRPQLTNLDGKYGWHFSAVGTSIQELETPYRTPHANGFCERFMGSLRRECLDPILIREDKYLRQVVNAYTAYFNRERPHQGIDQQIPDQYELPRSKPTSGSIISKAILGGLHHSYSRTAYLK